MIDYVTSDLHLGHGNIIEYTNRPFETADEMDSELISNWNSEVSESDTVLFLGDLTLAGTEKAKEFLEQLNGTVIFIAGNHDKLKMHTEGSLPVYNAIDFDVKGISFYATHYPEEIPNVRWLLYGHVHNNNVKKYPFYDPNNNRFNLSTEVTGFTPVPMEDIIKTIKNRNTIQKTYSP